MARNKWNPKPTDIEQMQRNPWIGSITYIPFTGKLEEEAGVGNLKRVAGPERTSDGPGH